MKLFNALSLNMLGISGLLRYEQIESAEARQCLLLDAGTIESFIGHPETARVVARELRLPDDLYNRAHGTIEVDDRVVIIAQYVGPRLAEGATSLPPGAEIRFYRVIRLSAETLDGLLQRCSNEGFDAVSIESIAIAAGTWI